MPPVSPNLTESDPVADPQPSEPDEAKLPAESRGTGTGRPSGREPSALFRAFLSANVDPETAYTAIREIESMSGQQVVAQINAHVTAQLQTIAVDLDRKFTVALAALERRIEQRFAAEVEKIEERFAAQDKRIEERFAAQDKKIEERLSGQDRKLDMIVDRLGRIEISLAETRAETRKEFDSVRTQLRLLWGFLSLLVGALVAVLTGWLGS